VFNNPVHIFPNNESKRVGAVIMDGSKVAIAGLNTEIDDILAQFIKENPLVTFFRGKENLWTHMKTWMFQKSNSRQYRQKLINLMMTGIYSFWKYWLRDRKYIEAELKLMNSPPTPLSLSSNVFFVFVILIFGLVLATIGFLIERPFKYFSMLYDNDISKSLVLNSGLLHQRFYSISQELIFKYSWIRRNVVEVGHQSCPVVSCCNDQNNLRA